MLKCGVCHCPLPSGVSHEHHEIPQAAGGAAGPTERLCAGCHANLHQVAHMLMGGRAGEAEDTAKILYPEHPTRVRFFKLIQMVVEYMTLKRDGKIQGKEPVRTVIELEPDLHFAAKTIANDHRGPTGRRLGFAHWIEALVKREIFKRYPHMDHGDAKAPKL